MSTLYINIRLISFTLLLAADWLIIIELLDNIAILIMLFKSSIVRSAIYILYNQNNGNYIVLNMATWAFQDRSHCIVLYCIVLLIADWPYPIDMKLPMQKTYKNTKI